MTSRFSTACGICGRVDDLTTVRPTGIHMDEAVLWRCRCGNTRSITIDRYTPQILVRRAMRADEKKKERSVDPEGLQQETFRYLPSKEKKR